MTNTTAIRTKILPIEVNPDDPFEKDALDREKLCEDLSKFIEKSITPYTLAIDAQWGDGKTTLLHMLKAHMTQQGFVCVSYDAWECDFYGDALPTLIGEIQRQIKEIEGYKEPAKKQFEEKGRKLLNSVISLEVILPATVKALSGGVAADKISDMVSKTLEGHNEIKRYLDYKEAVDEFKTELKDLALKIKEETKKPLVIFVDELDRCRPIFAIEVLEKVKHLFNVESIVFVFAINISESIKTIRTVYGNINGGVYLRKFFDRVIPLKNTSSLIRQSDIDYPHLFMCKKMQHFNPVFYPSQFLDLFIQDYNIPLRDQEQMQSIIGVVLCRKEVDFFLNPVLLAYFVILKFANPDLYLKSKIAMENRDISQLPFAEYDSFHKEKVGMSIREKTDEAVWKERERGGESVRIHVCSTLYAIGYKIEIEYQEYVNRRKEEVTLHRSDLAFWQHVDTMTRTIESHMFSTDTTLIDEIDRIGDFVDSIDNPQ